jgi:hypothetical protein
VAWIEAQPWFTGRIHTYGGSYVGMTQWALTPRLPASVEAMVIAVSARSFLHSILRHRGGFGMETAVAWQVVLGSMEDSALRQLAGVEAAHTEPAVRIRPIGSQQWLSFDTRPPPGHLPHASSARGREPATRGCRSTVGDGLPVRPGTAHADGRRPLPQRLDRRPPRPEAP